MIKRFELTKCVKVKNRRFSRHLNGSINCLLFQVRRLILAPIQNPHLEIVLVMFIVPFIINVSLINYQLSLHLKALMKSCTGYSALCNTFWIGILLTVSYCCFLIASIKQRKFWSLLHMYTLIKLHPK